MGKFEYESGATKFKGAFNVYQARNGAIMLLMGAKASALTYSQINDLNINCYELAVFNLDTFQKYYLRLHTPDVSNRRELYFDFMKEYNSLMGESEHQILKEEVEVLLAKYS